MKTYTANELQNLVNAAYAVGFDDAKNRRDATPKPPALRELVRHSYASGLRLVPKLPPYAPPAKAG